MSTVCVTVYLFVLFFSSLTGRLTGKMISAAIPTGLGGQTYVFVTKSSVTMLQDSAVLYGPAVLEVNPAPPSIDYSQQ